MMDDNVKNAPPGRGQDTRSWHERILSAILSVGIVLALFAFAPMTLMAVSEELPIIILLNAVICAAAIVMLVSRRIRYEIRAAFTLLLVFAVGLYVILFFGLLSGGPVCLFAFAVLAGLLLGLRSAVAAVIINGLTLMIFGWLAATGRWGAELPFFPNFPRGMVAWATFLLMNAVAAVSASVLVRGLREVSEKERAAREALHESEIRYRLLAENVSDVIWTVDLKTLRHTYVSPSIMRMRGLTPEEAIKQSIEEILSPESVDRVTEALAEEMARDGEAGVDPKRSRTLVIQHRRKDGSTFWAEATMTFIRDAQGRPIEILGVTRDISERLRTDEEKKMLEEKLQESQKLEAIANLAGGIAHKYNNTLSAIVGRLELLDLEPSGEELRRHIGPMKEAAHLMANLTNQLLAYAMGGKYQAKSIPFCQFVTETLPLIEHTVDPSVQVETELSPSILPVTADATQMQMVLSAILSNASEAIGGEGHIRVSCREFNMDEEDAVNGHGLPPGSYARLTVEDNGKGMDRETRNRIFDPFFTTKSQGSGLGMAAVYGIIKNHGGTISVDSEPGRGTSVHVYLPLTGGKALAAHAERTEKHVPSPRTETILLIEDNEMVMETNEALLEKLGYRVVPARTGREAVDAANGFEGAIDMALLDLKLPDMDAKNVYKELIKARPGMKVIVYSGYSLEGPAQEILDEGASGFIQKPFSMEELAGKIQEVLHK